MEDLLKKTYQLMSDLLAYPEEIDREEVELAVAELARPLAETAGDEAAQLLADFACESKTITVGDYIETLELNPKCPLYLGCYVCEGGPDGPKRRQFMCDMIDIYQFHGLRLDGREHPDFLPVVLECLWYSLDAEDLRPRVKLIHEYVMPAVPKLEAELQKIDSPYAKLVRALRAVLEFDLEIMLKEEASNAVSA
ncbi:MAG: nitrate reductase molybdenum cofactor assembly chaperone [Armatimonadetes bacterium]|nr:nitrate reductase molybdenum cofactor assembly chaperone [Armatimonadota bacterium]